MLSNQPLSTWLGNLTFFDGFYKTLPRHFIQNALYETLVTNIAPHDGPVIVSYKDQAPYFVTCLLKETEFVGKTLERAIENGVSRVGLQRSAAHVTESAILVYDIDGIDQEAFSDLVNRLVLSGLTALIYSTYSFGLPEKPGVRVRILIPLDRALAQSQYSRAWFGFVSRYLSDIEGLDQSCSRIHQQQGVWCAHPNRSHLAFRIDMRGGLVSADAAIAAGPEPIEYKPYQSVEYPITVSVARIQSASEWWDAESTVEWISNITCLKAISSMIGTNAAREIAIKYSARGSENATARNTEPQFDPATFFDNVKPLMAANLGFAVLCARALTKTLHEVEASQKSGHWTPRGKDAAIYLATYHRSRFLKLRGVR